jgi:hypothetical protein
MTLSWPKGLGFIGKNEYETQEWFMNRLFKCAAMQKLQELDKLAAGGYITPEEYKTKRKAILDGM